jgi:hypothetical protein
MARLVVYVEIPLNSATVQKDIDKLAKVVGKSAYDTSLRTVSAMPVARYGFDIKGRGRMVVRRAVFHADRQEAAALAARLTRHGYKFMFEVDEDEPDA